MVDDCANQSSLIENKIRFISFEVLRESGIKNAFSYVEDNKRTPNVVNAIGVDNVNKICKGVRTELRFFLSFAEKYHLIPTLDVGCQSDFVGLIDGIPQCIDVTSTISCKREQSQALSYGKMMWPRKLVELSGEDVTWYEPKPEGKSKKGMECSVVESEIGMLNNVSDWSKYNRDALEHASRYDLLRALTKKERLSCVLSQLNKNEELDSRCKQNIECQLRFFVTYRHALNLIPALSGNSMIDFVGQWGNVPTCYYIKTDTIERSDYFDAFCNNARGFIPYVAQWSDDEWQFYDPEELTVFL